jgi:hypothetical protein
MNQTESNISQAIDAVYAALAGVSAVKDPRVEAHLSNALESLVSALHGDYEKDEDSDY